MMEHVDDVAYYRIAPVLLVRLVGSYLVLFALITAVATVVVALLSLPGDLVAGLIGLGLVVLFGGAAWLRARAYVVRLDATGYRVRVVRGVGVREGRWSDVVEAVATRRRDVACVVLRRADGTETAVPVDVIAADRDVFARDVQARLRTRKA